MRSCPALQNEDQIIKLPLMDCNPILTAAVACMVGRDFLVGNFHCAFDGGHQIASYGPRIASWFPQIDLNTPAV